LGYGDVALGVTSRPLGVDDHGAIVDDLYRADAFAIRRPRRCVGSPRVGDPSSGRLPQRKLLKRGAHPSSLGQTVSFFEAGSDEIVTGSESLDRRAAPPYDGRDSHRRRTAHGVDSDGWIRRRAGYRVCGRGRHRSGLGRADRRVRWSGLVDLVAGGPIDVISHEVDRSIDLRVDDGPSPPRRPSA